MQPATTKGSTSPPYLLRIITLILLIVAAIAAATLIPSNQKPTAGTPTTTTTNTPDDTIPPPSDYVRELLATSKGFQALVSYTDSGFEPKSLTIRQGDTVRFTNNSSETLWIEEITDTPSGGINPLTGKDCGSTKFNSCRLLQPGDFWEHTFTNDGSFEYNNRDSEATSATIIVQN